MKLLPCVLLLVLLGCEAKRDHLAEGRAALAARDYDLAERCLTLAVQENPRDPAVWTARAEARISVRRYVDTVADATESIRLRPTNNPTAYGCRAAGLLGMGDQEGYERDWATYQAQGR